MVCGDVQSHVGCAGNRCACVCVDACSGWTVGASGHWLTAVNTSTCNTQLLCGQWRASASSLFCTSVRKAVDAMSTCREEKGAVTVHRKHSSRLAPVTL